MFRFAGSEATVCRYPVVCQLRVVWRGLVFRGGGGFAMRVIEREKGHYEVHDVPYGKVYSWCPERVLFECDCGEMLTWKAPATLCRCGASYTDVPSRETEERRANGEAYRPWLEGYEEWRKVKLANDLRHEYFGFVKAQDND
jgi:hypothetical protein